MVPRNVLLKECNDKLLRRSRLDICARLSDIPLYLGPYFRNRNIKAIICLGAKMQERCYSYYSNQKRAGLRGCKWISSISEWMLALTSESWVKSFLFEKGFALTLGVWNNFVIIFIIPAKDCDNTDIKKVQLKIICPIPLTHSGIETLCE